MQASQVVLNSTSNSTSNIVDLGKKLSDTDKDSVDDGVELRELDHEGRVVTSQRSFVRLDTSCFFWASNGIIHQQISP